MVGNNITDLNAHYHLKGKIFKRKAMDPKRLYGLAYFGLAGTGYFMFPAFALHLGSTLTTAGITASALAGMVKFQEKDIVNSIEVVRDENSPNNGALKFSVSTGPLFTSRTIYANVQDCQSVFTVGNDDVGEDDLETNVVQIKSSWDEAGNVNEEIDQVVLPADSYKDLNMLDWILSIKDSE